MLPPNTDYLIALITVQAKGVVYSPHTIRRAIENTAKHIENVEPWSQVCNHSKGAGPNKCII